jgi:outer membrane protein OmpA-like peptidoglycan-associated protein
MFTKIVLIQRLLTFAAVALFASLAVSPAHAQARGELYTPGIWIDPDGCEHWVIDDGFEGYMTPHVTPEGLPVCRKMNTCGIMPSDQFFATDSARISRKGKAWLREFFQKASAFSFIIAGHTDSRASQEYNQSLSERRAEAVADVARTTGVRISAVRGFGELRPRASNGTAAGMEQNRRVEIICVQ